MPRELIREMRHGTLEAGVDEAGRGSLAGPVVAAAVIWDPNVDATGIRDSKKLSKKKRAELKEYIVEHAISYAVHFVDNVRIDNVNILQATMDAMHGALDSLDVVPDYLLIDGPYFREYKDIPHATVPNGDDTYVNIAAASILAKVMRDEYMCTCNTSIDYGWDHNAGYGTAQHLAALKEHGVTPLHRLSFRPVADAAGTHEYVSKTIKYVDPKKMKWRVS